MKDKIVPILLVGGGTGGHITPLIAVAEGLTSRSIPFLFVGSRGGPEEELVGKNYPYKAIYAGKWRRYFTPSSFGKNLVDLVKIKIGFWQSLWLIWKTGARVVFCKGGYVAVPVVIAAWILRRKVIVHESDAVMGVANRFASHFASKVLTAFDPMIYPNHDQRYTQVGIPIRNSLRQAATLKSPKKSRSLVLIMPGSQGSTAINQHLAAVLPELLIQSDVVHMTGKDDYQKFQRLYEQLAPGQKSHYKVFAYIDRELPYYFQAADLIIGRASATTVAEAALFAKPIFLIPLPGAATDHQTKNASRLFEAEAAWIQDQANLTDKSFIQQISGILGDPEEAKKRGENLRKYFNTQDSLDRIISELT
ncbi:MAG TPA: UDP-N-acetylglucosamine--N-acetylmuramyl-(pentapeptide) pyrophosphoryl-undecaprenol N-acetylglucosamine transferase [Candidatus Saccharimonadales bacterium]|nr:UDP-N-acetylglucosamine--N-acetylmuramyl-(pentapeptide) pyrophosphoryl-undecaprenol N-acetylglucosamine transferase [Candidatus Saccharimonadales bacterium]